MLGDTEIDSVVDCLRSGWLTSGHRVKEFERDFAAYVGSAHALPTRHRGRMVGTLGDVTCFSFYATKTITTGEGGMAVTDREDYAERMRLMHLHGMSHDAWKRYTKNGSWGYEILAAGFKYNLTDIAASIGIAQLTRADAFHTRR